MKILSEILVTLLVGSTAANPHAGFHPGERKSPPCTKDGVHLPSKPALPSEGYHHAPTEGYPAEPTGGYPSQPTDGYPLEPTDGYPGEPPYKSSPTFYPTASTPAIPTNSSTIPSTSLEPSSSSLSTQPPPLNSSTPVITPSATPTALTEYVIVSPEACLIAPKPTGTPISQSDANFTETNGGLTYAQYPDGLYMVQANDTSPTQYLDFSLSTQLSIRDEDGNTLVLFTNGTYAVYTAQCEVAVFGVWNPDAMPNMTRRADTTLAHLDKRQIGTGVCKEIQFFCSNVIGQAFNAIAANGLCYALGKRVGQTVGGGIGFLGNVFGPEVGIPTTIGGIVLGGRIGAFFSTLYGSSLCAATMTYATSKLCAACPDPKLCGEGTLKCSINGPCQDVLSDPNNCGACGNQCPSSRCRNGQCTQPTCNKSVCSNLNMCNPTCYCFTTAGGTGFCGPSTPCAGLADCTSDFDCRQGLICAVGTCCGRNVCHPPCAGVFKRDGDVSNNATEMYSNGLGGVTNLLSLGGM